MSGRTKTSTVLVAEGLLEGENRTFGNPSGCPGCLMVHQVTAGGPAALPQWLHTEAVSFSTTSSAALLALPENTGKSASVFLCHFFLPLPSASKWFVSF